MPPDPGDIVSQGVSERLRPDSRPAAEDRFEASCAPARDHTASKVRRTLICPESSCSYNGVFRRNYDLQRHLATHDRKYAYECTALGCTKGGDKTRFARADKLTSHMRSVHQSGQFECSHIGCMQSPLDRLDMFVHVQGHIDASCNKPDGQLRAMANGLSPTFRRCPILFCGRTASPDNMIDHLLSHDWGDLVSASDELAVEGYSYGSTAGDEEPGLNLSWTMPFIRIFILCPLCSSRCSDPKSFEAHLMEYHLQKDIQHFNIWLAHVKDRLLSHGYTMLDAAAETGAGQLDRLWKAWRFVLMSSRAVAVDFCCPDCKAIERGNDDLLVVHHLSMLNHPRKFFACRREILLLCPSFASHPVFKDLHDADRVQEPHVVRLRAATNSTREIASSSTACSLGSLTSEIADQIVKPTRERERPFETCITVSSEECHDVLIGVGRQFATSSETESGHNAYDFAYSDARSHMLRPSISPLPHAVTAFFPAGGGVADEGPRRQNLGERPATVQGSYGQGRKHACGHPNCSLRFERRSELSAHQRSHVMKHERPHKCGFCNHAFMFAKDLARHQRTHKACLCPVPKCEHTFISSTVRDSHMIEAHGLHNLTTG